jgi:dihydroneopterin aldolase
MNYQVRIRDLLLSARIGIHGFEKSAPQRVLVSVDLDVAYPEQGFADDFDRVYCYEALVDSIRGLCAEGHINLVESLAERILDAALADDRSLRAAVTVEKLDVLGDVKSVGVTLERAKLV